MYINIPSEYALFSADIQIITVHALWLLYSAGSDSPLRIVSIGVLGIDLHNDGSKFHIQLNQMLRPSYISTQDIRSTRALRIQK